MARHLVIARQTAGSEELLAAMRRVAEDDPEAAFVLLLPETPLQHLRMVSADTARELAEKAADEALAWFTAAGLHLATVKIADPNPVLAATTELAEHPGCEGIIVSTYPPGLSRWLKMDGVSRLERMTSLPITHVVAEEPGQ